MNQPLVGTLARSRIEAAEGHLAAWETHFASGFRLRQSERLPYIMTKVAGAGDRFGDYHRFVMYSDV